MKLSRRRPKTPERMSRQITFTSVLIAESSHGKGGPSSSGPTLHLNGEMNEPVGDVRETRITLAETVDAESRLVDARVIGLIVEKKPVLEFYVIWPASHFDRIWAMALADQIKFGRIVFERPRYKSGGVFDLTLSNHS